MVSSYGFVKPKMPSIGALNNPYIALVHTKHMEKYAIGGRGQSKAYHLSEDCVSLVKCRPTSGGKKQYRVKPVTDTIIELRGLTLCANCEGRNYKAGRWTKQKE